MSRSNPESTGSGAILPSGDARARLRLWRNIKDVAARYTIGGFGIAVIFALALIFLYLFSEVLPLLRPAGIESTIQYEAPGGAESETLHLAMNRHQEIGVRLTDRQEAVFFDPRVGEVVGRQPLPIPEGASVVSVSQAEPRARTVALGLDNGQALVVGYEYNERFVDGERLYEPSLNYPLGDETESLFTVDDSGAPIAAIGVQSGESGTSLAARTTEGRMLLVRFEKETSMMTGEVEVTRSRDELPPLPEGAEATRILLDTTMQNLIVGDDRGRLHYYDVSSPSRAERVDSRSAIKGDGARVTAMEYLLGTVSFIVGGSDGSVTQYMLVRDEDNIKRITRVRAFSDHAAEVTDVVPEYIRKGFSTADAAGRVKIHYSTSHRTVLEEKLAERSLRQVYVAPRNDGLVTVDASETWGYHGLRNPHPEVSLHALWQKVWYEGRSEPEFVWQSSSATDEYEPKYSLVPLTLGTVKAAFYAMLFATPLAVMGAIYSAYFMSGPMRRLTKPAIELMEALPTVILGFLAGLWLAPFLESNLPAVFGILVVLPLAMLAMAYFWTRVLPRDWRRRIPGGWEAAILIPVILLVGWVAVSVSPVIEVLFFEGDLRQWLTNHGYTYDQRNALVIGLAMGFAVIPTIYSISEDAIFNVPKHLTQGSLALGATAWQTMTRVVLLTASPGIFSAVMIGLGRAVGETMIVLMATGNSPVMNFNLFEGMRTLSANIAVEIPEAAVGSTHFRILFLAALVLFLMTFVLNTMAEVVRQRLRRKYSSL